MTASRWAFLEYFRMCEITHPQPGKSAPWCCFCFCQFVLHWPYLLLRVVVLRDIVITTLVRQQQCLAGLAAEPMFCCVGARGDDVGDEPQRHRLSGREEHPCISFCVLSGCTVMNGGRGAAFGNPWPQSDWSTFLSAAAIMFVWYTGATYSR